VLQLPRQIPKVLILDRDGTLIEHVHHLIDPKKAILLANVGRTLQIFADLGTRFVVVTNQSVIQRGLATHFTVTKIHDVINELLLDFEVSIDAYYVCPHLNTSECKCRKPAIELGLRVLKDFKISPSEVWVIGDQESDMQFARTLGSIGIKIGEAGLLEDSAAFNQFDSWLEFYSSVQEVFR
jgi:D-glycero-D-manno-heptose 1,7-bisphosphate phosphatase